MHHRWWWQGGLWAVRAPSHLSTRQAWEAARRFTEPTGPDVSEPAPATGWRVRVVRGPFSGACRPLSAGVGSMGRRDLLSDDPQVPREAFWIRCAAGSMGLAGAPGTDTDPAGMVPGHVRAGSHLVRVAFQGGGGPGASRPPGVPMGGAEPQDGPGPRPTGPKIHGTHPGMWFSSAAFLLVSVAVGWSTGSWLGVALAACAPLSALFGWWWSRRRGSADGNLSEPDPPSPSDGAKGREDPAAWPRELEERWDRSWWEGSGWEASRGEPPRLRPVPLVLGHEGELAVTAGADLRFQGDPAAVDAFARWVLVQLVWARSALVVVGHGHPWASLALTAGHVSFLPSLAGPPEVAPFAGEHAAHGGAVAVLTLPARRQEGYGGSLRWHEAGSSGAAGAPGLGRIPQERPHAGGRDDELLVSSSGGALFLSRGLARHLTVMGLGEEGFDQAAARFLRRREKREEPWDAPAPPGGAAPVPRTVGEALQTLPVPDQAAMLAGFTQDGTPVWLDFERDGPHFLVSGTSGSGKSELLCSLVLSLALPRSPEAVSLFLCDFKGGTSLMPCERLPHVAYFASNSAIAEADRALTMVQAELSRRERLLKAAACDSLAAYASSPEGRRLPLPRLLVVIDEFRVLIEELPGAMDRLIRLCTVGRSLGVHLILATQQAAGVVPAGLKANIGSRICLRVREAADSVDVLGVPDAAALPAVPGAGLVARPGSRAPLALQCCPVRDGRGQEVAVCRIDPEVRTLDPDRWPWVSTSWKPAETRVVPAKAGPPAPTGAGVADPPPLMFPPPLPPRLRQPATQRQAGRVELGRWDDPENLAQGTLRWDLRPGSGLAVAGGPGSGRTTCLRTALRCALLPGGAEAPQLFVLGVESGDGTSAPWVQACAGWAGSGDLSQAERVVESALASALAGLGPVVLVDDWDRWEADALDAGADHWLALAFRLLRHPGAAVAVSAGTSLVTGRISSRFGSRLVLPFTDAHDAQLCGVPAGLAHPGPPGRAWALGSWTGDPGAGGERAVRTERPRMVQIFLSPPSAPPPSTRHPRARAHAAPRRPRKPAGTPAPGVGFVGPRWAVWEAPDQDLSSLLVAGPEGSGRGSVLRGWARAMAHHLERGSGPARLAWFDGRSDPRLEEPSRFHTCPGCGAWTATLPRGLAAPVDPIGPGTADGAGPLCVVVSHAGDASPESLRSLRSRCAGRWAASCELSDVEGGFNSSLHALATSGIRIVLMPEGPRQASSFGGRPRVAPLPEPGTGWIVGPGKLTRDFMVSEPEDAGWTCRCPPGVPLRDGEGPPGPGRTGPAW